MFFGLSIHVSEYNNHVSVMLIVFTVSCIAVQGRHHEIMKCLKVTYKVLYFSYSTTTFSSIDYWNGLVEWIPRIDYCNYQNALILSLCLAS